MKRIKGTKHLQRRAHKVLAALLFIAFASTSSIRAEGLQSTLEALIARSSGTIGIAFVGDEDSLSINNSVRFPMMSVFKLHQALAVANALRDRDDGFQMLLHIPATEPDHDTWSPMLRKYGDGDLDITVGELLDYALIMSDNNASNILFNHIVSPRETDRFVKSVASDSCFQILYSEADMKKNHSLSYENFTSPMAAALLIRKVFTTDFLRIDYQNHIRNALTNVTTGSDRLGGALQNKPGVLFAHKTGSGYRNADGKLMAFNDVGYVRLPDGRDYSVAVLIRDFAGSEAEASAIMAEISRLIYEHFTAKHGD